MICKVSVIIPNRNSGATIGQCLEAVFSSDYKNLEVIVVDDASDDDSTEIIDRFPCKLTRLETHSGASAARNIGAQKSQGEILFFTDADCLPLKNTITVVSSTLARYGRKAIVGGTYTKRPSDMGFFSLFQSIFINYFETKNFENPDYIATHAMAVDAVEFRASGGFKETMGPILEDVEFSHRVKKAGFKLIMNSRILVRHIFNFSIFGSVFNAARKSMYWTIYSIANNDLLSDSGAASKELKINVVLSLLAILALFLSFWTNEIQIAYLAPLFYSIDLVINRGLVKAFYDTGGAGFAISAFLYYSTVYAMAVGAGAVSGVIKYGLNLGIRLVDD